MAADDEEVCITVKFAGTVATVIRMSKRSTVAELKQRIAAVASLPPPHLQKLISHARILQAGERIDRIHGARTGALNVLLLEVVPGPTRLVRFRHAAGFAWGRGFNLMSALWQLARGIEWRDLLTSLGRAVILFFQTLVMPTPPGGGERGDRPPAQ